MRRFNSNPALSRAHWRHFLAVKIIATCICVCALAWPTFAAEPAARPAGPLDFTRLDLLDGRKLQNASIKSYDAKNDQAIIVSEKKVLSVPVSLIPPPFATQVRALPPRPYSDVRPSAPANPAQTAEPAAPARVERKRPSPAPSPSPIDPEREARKLQETLAAHKEVAMARLEKYYRYEYMVGPISVKVTALDFEVSRPRAVPGWEGRYEMQGKAYLEYFDSRGGSFQRTTSAFEIVTEERPGDEIKVVDLTKKS